MASPIHANPAEKLLDDPGRADIRDSGLNPFDLRDSGLNPIDSLDTGLYDADLAGGGRGTGLRLTREAWGLRGPLLIPYSGRRSDTTS